MKLEQEHSSALKSGSPLKTIQFGVSDMSIIMKVLSEMYSNKLATPIQEYICNARDANREVGNTRMEIAKLTRFNSEFKVRDYGPGLSPERVTEVFSCYGASTKRNTNGQTGGFGIGAKSAWCYTDTFTVTSFYEGVKYSYICSRSDGIPSMELVSEIETSEDNGVAVAFAVKDSDVGKANDAIRKTLFWWNPEEIPDAWREDIMEERNKFIKVADDIYLFPNHSDCRIVAIDGIQYTLPLGWLPNRIKLGRFVVIASTGELGITPSRESIVNDDSTKEFCQKVSVRLKTLADDERRRIESQFSIAEEYYKGEKETWVYCNSIFGDYSSRYGSRIQYEHKEIKLVSSARRGAEFVVELQYNFNRDGELYIDDLPDESSLYKRARYRTVYNTVGHFYVLPEKCAADWPSATKLSTVEKTLLPKQSKQSIGKQTFVYHVWNTDYKSRQMTAKVEDYNVKYYLRKDHALSKSDMNYLRGRLGRIGLLSKKAIKLLGEAGKLGINAADLLPKMKLTLAQKLFVHNHKTILMIGHFHTVQVDNSAKETTLLKEYLDSVEYKVREKLFQEFAKQNAFAIELVVNNYTSSAFVAKHRVRFRHLVRGFDKLKSVL